MKLRRDSDSGILIPERERIWTPHRERDLSLNHNMPPPSFWAKRGTPAPASLKLLLHFEGAHNSTTLADSSGYGWTAEGNGAVYISTAQAKWGTSSLRISRQVSCKGVRIIPENSTALAHGINEPWFIDFWIYIISMHPVDNVNTLYRFISESGAHFNSYEIARRSGYGNQYLGRQDWNSGGEEPVWDGYLPPLATGTWHHIACGFDGTTQRRWTNGTVSKETVRSSLASASTEGYIDVGGNAENSNITPDGTTEYYLDEFRFLLGECPYIDDFLVPTGPYNYS